MCNGGQIEFAEHAQRVRRRCTAPELHKRFRIKHLQDARNNLELSVARALVHRRVVVRGDNRWAVSPRRSLFQTRRHRPRPKERRPACSYRVRCLTTWRTASSREFRFGDEIPSADLVPPTCRPACFRPRGAPKSGRSVQMWPSRDVAPRVAGRRRGVILVLCGHEGLARVGHVVGIDVVQHALLATTDDDVRARHMDGARRSQVKVADV
jgi:hypothetical protein